MTTAEAKVAAEWAELAWSSSHTQRHILKLADQAQELGMGLDAGFLRYVAAYLEEFVEHASREP